MDTKLLDTEKLFCELYATGDAPYAGNAQLCYTEAFNYSGKKSKHKALELLAKPEIQEYLETLEKLSYEESRYMKKFLTQNLMNIVTECSGSTYRDKRGTALSPAPLRSVAVNASKALMDMYAVKEAQKLNIGSDSEGGITFNVIMPDQPATNPKQE